MSNSSHGSSQTLEIVRLRPLARTDRAPLESILRRTGSFTEDEVVVALELIDEPFNAVPDTDYQFVVAARGETVLGYACFGPTPLTEGVYDLYWIAVDPTLHGQGVGREIVERVEEIVAEQKGRMILIETASKSSYAATRAFYDRTGYLEVARVPDFYRIGDDKVIYAKRIP